MDLTEEPEMRPTGGDAYVVRAYGTSAWTPVLLHQLVTGRHYVHKAYRATPMHRRGSGPHGQCRFVLMISVVRRARDDESGRGFMRSRAGRPVPPGLRAVL